jgi:hypothetical protein
MPALRRVFPGMAASLAARSVQTEKDYRFANATSTSPHALASIATRPYPDLAY